MPGTSSSGLTPMALERLADLEYTSVELALFEDADQFKPSQIAADVEAAAASWKSFGADPEWHKVVQITEAGGKLVTRVDSTYLAPTDFSALK